MKKITRTLCAAAICAVLSFGSVFAADELDAKTVAAAKELMQTLKVKEQMGPAFEGVKKMQGAMLDQQELSDEEKAAVKEIMVASMEEVEKAMSWDNIENIMVNAYASVFTTKELNDLDALFLSPAGQTFVAKQPQLQAATMKEMQAIMMGLMPKIQKSTEEAIERVKNQQK